MNILRFRDVKNQTGLSRSTIFRLEKKGDFPARRKMSSRTVGWIQSEVEEWMKSREKIGEA